MIGRHPRLLFALLLGATVVVLGPVIYFQYHLRRARAELARHRHLQAAHHLERCSLLHGSAHVCLLRARAARFSGDADEAERWLGACRKREGKPTDESVLEWALLRAENGNMEAVENYLQGLLTREHPQSASILESLAVGYLRLYRFFEAMNALNRCLELDPENGRGHFLRGRAWERVHAYSRAADEFRQVLALDQEHQEARLKLARCLFETSKYAAAIEQLETLLEQHPDHIEAKVQLALTLNAIDPGSRRAAELLDKVLDEDERLDALYARGLVALDQGDLDEAEKLLRRVVRRSPFDRAAHFQLHRCLQRQGKKAAARVQEKKLKEVERVLERLIALTNREMPRRPNDATLHHELGTLLEKMGRMDLAASWYLSTLQHAPAHREAHLGLARYHEGRGEREEAAKHRRAAGQ